MNPSPSEQKTWLRTELLTLFSLSATLTGLCITGVTLFGSLKKSALDRTVADELLAVAAMIFLLCTYIIFITLKSQHQKIAWWLQKLADLLFLVALTFMVTSGVIMIFTVI